MPRKLLRRVLPSPHWIRQHRLLAWLKPSLHHPRVWHVSREGIALGVAIGIFFGLAIPFAQIPVACAVAILLRANLAVALVGTFITNPFTFAPLYYFAFRIGAMVTGADPSLAGAESSFGGDAGGAGGWLGMWSGRIMEFGKPLLVGLLLMATVLSLASYLAVQVLWRVLTMRAWRRRSRVK